MDHANFRNVVKKGELNFLWHEWVKIIANEHQISSPEEILKKMHVSGYNIKPFVIKHLNI